MEPFRKPDDFFGLGIDMDDPAVSICSNYPVGTVLKYLWTIRLFHEWFAFSIIWYRYHTICIQSISEKKIRHNGLGGKVSIKNINFVNGQFQSHPFLTPSVSMRFPINLSGPILQITSNLNWKLFLKNKILCLFTTTPHFDSSQLIRA